MFVFAEKFLEFFKNTITIAGPVIIILFTLALIAGMVKWSYRTKEWLNIVSSNPILLFIWIIISIIGLYMFFKYIPIINV